MMRKRCAACELKRGEGLGVRKATIPVPGAIKLTVAPHGLSGERDCKALRSSSVNMGFTLIQYPSSKMIL